jgi:hypothetical protein
VDAAFVITRASGLFDHAENRREVLMITRDGSGLGGMRRPVEQLNAWRLPGRAN